MSTSKAAPAAASTPLSSTSGPGPAVTVACAWFVPGAGHFLHGQMQKAVVFAIVICLMFGLGLGLNGRLFPFDFSEPLVVLAAGAEWVLGILRVVAAFGGWGRGEVTAITFEYGNTFLITAGLLNALVVLDAYDLATGRKKR
jgi:hypothetical protein